MLCTFWSLCAFVCHIFPHILRSRFSNIHGIAPLYLFRRFVPVSQLNCPQSQLTTNCNKAGAANSHNAAAFIPLTNKYSVTVYFSFALRATGGCNPYVCFKLETCCLSFIFWLVFEAREVFSVQRVRELNHPNYLARWLLIQSD